VIQSATITALMLVTCQRSLSTRTAKLSVSYDQESLPFIFHPCLLS